MEHIEFLLQLTLILFSARIFGELAALCKIPSVIGELCAGLILGPSVLKVVTLTEPIHLLAQIGIILLLFEVGIDTDLSKLIAAGKKACVVAICGALLPFISGYYVASSLLQLPLLPSLFIGSALTATSIGITLRVLKDLNKLKTAESQIILGAAVLDDLIGIILLAILYDFSITNQVNMVTTGKTIGLMILYFAIAPILVKSLSIILNGWDKKSTIPGILPTCIVALVLFFSWLADNFGVPEILGGFAVGLALSKKFPFNVFPHLTETPEFTHRVEREMQPIVHLFTPIFFVSIGLSLDLTTQGVTASTWQMTFWLFLVAIIGKLLSALFLRKESFFKKCIIGSAMVPRGEVGLVFANIGRSTEVLSQDQYIAMVFVIALTTLLAPFFLRALYSSKYDRC